VRFGLHPLAVEDAVHAHQRPKLEAYDDLLFAVVKTVHYDGKLPGGTAEVTSLVSANLARVSVVQNEDMRKISAWVAIAAVPTMLAGIYGMNFTHMAELTWEFGYPLALVVTATFCAMLYRVFKRIGWL
jgi:Mg2+ and Co2+ transporter CorA